MRHIAAALLLWASTASASEAPPFELRGAWQQGHVLIGSIIPGAQVWFNERKLSLSPEGDFIFGLNRDEPPDATIKVQLPGGPVQIYRYTVEARVYDIQHVDGLPPDKVNPPAKETARIEREQSLIRAAREHDSARTDFLETMQWPVQGRISGVYGSQRVLNGEPKAPHFGIDIAVPTGTRLVAPAGGVVRLAQTGFYFTGGTLVIDHGHGLSSIMVHLSKLLVKEGDMVKRGQSVAQSGMTGRATGPHLHWGMFWFDVRIDAASLVPPMRSGSAN